MSPSSCLIPVDNRRLTVAFIDRIQQTIEDTVQPLVDSIQKIVEVGFSLQ